LPFRVRRGPRAIGDRVVATRRRRRVLPPDTIPNMVADAALADYGADDGLLFPICVYVVTGTASAR